MKGIRLRPDDNSNKKGAVKSQEKRVISSMVQSQEAGEL
jgi:hypothetical protein